MTSYRGRVIGAFFLLLTSFPSLAGGRIEFVGINDEIEKSLRARLTVQTALDSTDKALVRNRYINSKKELREAFQTFGYYAPKIKNSLRFDPQNNWVARFEIDAGTRHVWEYADLRLVGMAGDDLPWFQRLQKLAKSFQGKGVDHRNYSQLKELFINTALENGYLDADYHESQLEIDENRRAGIVLTLETGPQYRFGQMHIEQAILNDAFLQRFNPVVPGDVFDTDTLLTFRLRLYDLDYFREIEIESARQRDDATVDLHVIAREKKPQRWQIGLGYGTDTGPRISSSVEFRYLNRHGHRADANARVSDVKTELGLRYVLPTGPEPGANWSFRTQRLTEKLGDTETTTLRTGLSRNRIHGARLWNYYVNYEGERFRLSSGAQKTDLIIPGVSLTLRQADSLLQPKRGYTVIADVHGTWDEFLSSTSFIQTKLDLSWIQPLSRKSRLILRGRTGANWLSEFDRLPASQRFFAGGDSSIRGYDYRKIAPRDSNNDIVGGKYLYTASIEVDRLLWRDYGLAVFHDSGNAANSWLGTWYSSTGVGLRWASPVGMVRLDFAVPHDDPDTNFQIHIGIGGEL